MLSEQALSELVHVRAAVGYGGRFFGAYPAVVRELTDPDGQGRVKVELPWSPDGQSATYSAWARLATLMAGNNRGTWFIPDVEDEVLVVFIAGDPSHPCIIGSLWNGSDAPPESMDGAGENKLKLIRSRNGVLVTLDDADGQERFKVETPGGQSMLLKDGPGGVEIQDSNGNSIKLESSGLTINASAKVTVSASNIELSAGSVTVNAGMSRFNGVVQADTVIASSVVASSYTPGAGNIW